MEYSKSSRTVYIGKYLIQPCTFSTTTNHMIITLKIPMGHCKMQSMVTTNQQLMNDKNERRLVSIIDLYVFVKSTVKLASDMVLAALSTRRYTCSATNIILSKKITDCSFNYASPCLSNQLPLSLRQPHSGTSSSISYSLIPSPITSFSFDSPLCSSITPCLSLPAWNPFHKS